MSCNQASAWLQWLRDDCNLVETRLRRQPTSRAAPEDVLVGLGPLVRTGVAILCAEVRAAGDEGLEQGGIIGRRRQHFGCERAVEVEEMGPRWRVEALRPGDAVEGGGSGQRPGPPREAADAEVVERVERDAPVRRQLAACDADHARRACREDRLALRGRGR